MHKLTITVLGLFLFGTTALADNIQSVVIEGSVVNKNVKTLTFEGNNVVIAFEDDTKQIADMSAVSITLTYGVDASMGISNIDAQKDKTSKVYTLSGQHAGSSIESLPKGLYIINGKKVVKK